MRALAQRMGTQRDYEVLISGSQSLQPPPGALEVDVKTFQVATLPRLSPPSFPPLCPKPPLTCQLRRLLEDTECDMIRAVQRRISGELTLVASEHARQEMGLPTGTREGWGAWEAMAEHKIQQCVCFVLFFSPGVWTELWRRAPLKYTLAPERPQVVEMFIQELIGGAEESGGQVSKESYHVMGPV